MSGTPRVLVPMPAELRAAIESHPEFVPPARGRRGGLAAWLEDAARQRLGWPPREDPHEQQRRAASP